MRHTQDSLTQALIGRRLLASDALPVPRHEQFRPWYVSAVLGLAGWLAGFFVSSFLSLLLDLDQPATTGILGTLLLAAAFGAYRIARGRPFLEQLGLAFSIAGQLALIRTAHELTDASAPTAALTTLLQLAVFCGMPNRIAKSLAACLACVAWAFTMRLVWLGEDFWNPTAASAFVPALLCWLTTWVAVLIAVHVLVTHEVRWIARGWQPLARPALTGMLASLPIAVVISEPIVTDRSMDWVVLWPLLSMLTSLFAAYCAFRVRDRPLLGLAVCGALVHVAHFYYTLGTTLLMKSCLMALLGAGLLLAARALQKRGVP